MRYWSLKLLLVVACSQLFACAEVKEAGRSIGHGTRDAAVAVGKGAKRVVNETAESVKEATE